VQNYNQHPTGNVNSICRGNIWRDQYGFRRKKSITDHVFSIRQILEKIEHKEAVHHLFIDFKKAYDTVTKEVMYFILPEFGIPMDLVPLMKMCMKSIAQSRSATIFLTGILLKMV
jgi:hypothetical protein